MTRSRFLGGTLFTMDPVVPFYSYTAKKFPQLATLSGQWKARAMGLQIRLIRTRFPLEILFSYPVHVNGLKSPSVFLANIFVKNFTALFTKMA